jgi:hypothetical protein
MKATVEISIKRLGSRCAFVEFDDDMDAERVYLDLVQELRHNQLTGTKRVQHSLVGKSGVSGSGLTK